jgi:type I restriction enzyme R subunit
VVEFTTSLDEYQYDPDDELIEGDIDENKVYTESDFKRIIEIEERERQRVKIFMEAIDQNEKTLVFCANQDHALAIRDLINQMAISSDPNYCARVTANDGSLGETHLKKFQDNEKRLPTILTTSRKLSTGVDARNLRNIVLLRPVKSMIEFKQIIGRGTRLFDNKDYFTIYDFVKAHENFNDPEWDGEPQEPVVIDPRPRPEPPDAIEELLDVYERHPFGPAGRRLDCGEGVHVHDRFGPGVSDHGRVHGCLGTGSSALSRECLASHIDEDSVGHLHC